MSSQQGRVVSVHVGSEGTLTKELRESIRFELDGIVGDRHRGISRECWEQDKQPESSSRRNERMWSAVSVEELAEISEKLGLVQPLSPASLGANICLEGVEQLSRLPRGTLLCFASGAVLMVEEYNPPCQDMGEAIAQSYTTLSGTQLEQGVFSDAAKFSRGIVGIVEVAGEITAGDSVTVVRESLPKWLRS